MRWNVCNNTDKSNLGLESDILMQLYTCNILFCFLNSCYFSLLVSSFINTVTFMIIIHIIVNTFFTDTMKWKCVIADIQSQLVQLLISKRTYWPELNASV